jgi:hypothetical protein
MPVRINESPPREPEQAHQPGGPHDEPRNSEQRRPETVVDPAKPEADNLEAIYGDDINTNGSER